MRAREFITEGEGSADGSSYGGNSGKNRPFDKNQKSVISGATRYPNTPSHYYNMYRFGVHMAGSPDDEHQCSPYGPSGNQMVTLAYSKADSDIIKKSAKAMGFTGNEMSSYGSREPEDTYKSSPVSNWNKK